jgi:hypothetical protein
MDGGSRQVRVVVSGAGSAPGVPVAVGCVTVQTGFTGRVPCHHAARYVSITMRASNPPIRWTVSEPMRPHERR